jgi:hypothetical protein
LAACPESLRRDVARWLVGWVAAGQPSRGPDHDREEARYHELMERKRALTFHKSISKAAPHLIQLSREYEVVWRPLIYGRL